MPMEESVPDAHTVRFWIPFRPLDRQRVVGCDRRPANPALHPNVPSDQKFKPAGDSATSVGMAVSLAQYK